MAARNTTEQGLGFPVTLLTTTAHRTRPRGVRRIDQSDGHTVAPGLVVDKRTQLEERPVHMSCALFGVTNPCPRANAAHPRVVSKQCHQNLAPTVRVMPIARIFPYALRVYLFSACQACCRERNRSPWVFLPLNRPVNGQGLARLGRIIGNRIALELFWRVPVCWILDTDIQRSLRMIR